MIDQLNHQELQEVLNDFYNVPEHPSLLLLGTFGIGKSEAMRQFCIAEAKKKGLEFSESFQDINDEKKFVFLKFIVHQFEGAEIKGLPFPNEDRTETVYLPMGLMPRKGQGLIFLDEINLASRMMQNNCYQLVEDRELGFYQVPPGYMVTGAGNMDSDRANLITMPLPLTDRFFRYQLTVPSEEEWIKNFALKRGVDHRVIGYLRFQPQDLYTYNSESDFGEEVDIATPRGWKRVSDILRTLPKDASTDKVRRYVSGKVGTAIGDKFVAWMAMSKDYDIAKIYAGKDFTVPKDIGVLYSLMSGIVGHYLNKQNDDTAVRFAELSSLFKKEHQVMLLDMAKSTDDDFFVRLKKGDKEMYNKLAESLFKLLVSCKQ